MGDVVTSEAEEVDETPKFPMPYCGACGVPTLLSLYAGAWWPCVVCYAAIQRGPGPFLEVVEVEQMSEADFRIYAGKVRKIQEAKVLENRQERASI